ncbi:MAG: DUF488 domain-containing protein [Candidatus Micrarchaeia archaeon]
MSDVIWSVGHSTRSLVELIELLKHYGIEVVADVRRFPASRKFPWFERKSLEQILPANGINYVWLGEELGGFRKGGYEAFARSDEFAAAIAELANLARKKRVAVMCAEKLWWRCHRRHVANALARQGWEVIHIFDTKRSEAHRMLGGG